jgi:hypothetical protein
MSIEVIKIDINDNTSYGGAGPKFGDFFCFRMNCFSDVEIKHKLPNEKKPPSPLD